MRSFLDKLYLASGVLAGLFLIAIGILVLLSIGTRLAGVYVPGLTQYAGYSMAAASFLALAHTFGRGGHIRVSVLLAGLKGGARRAAELWCLTIGVFVAGYFAWFSIKMVRVSYLLGDLSEGADATPLWVPQIAMALGTILLTVAMADRLLAVARGAAVDRPRTDASIE